MRIKNLIAKFSINQLISELPKQGWVIPKISDLEGKEVLHDVVWVDEPVELQDAMTHAYTYAPKIGKKMLANRNNLYNAVVLVEPKKCPHCEGEL